jgi:AcrR family transcriptional regulator
MPRTKKKDGTEDIISAALQVFVEKGFAHTTLGDVAARSGASVQAVRGKFESKEDLLIEAFRIGQRRMEAKLREIPKGGLDEHLELLFDAIVDGLAPFGPEIHLNLIYQATQDKVLEEIIKRSSGNVNFAVKAYLAQMVSLSIVDTIDEVEKVNREMVASSIEYLAGALEGKKLPAIKAAWIGHVRPLLRPSAKTNVPSMY